MNTLLFDRCTGELERLTFWLFKTRYEEYPILILLDGGVRAVS